MSQSAREEIFERLRACDQSVLQPRPEKAIQVELPDDVEGRISTFTTELQARSGTAVRVENGEAALSTLADIVHSEGIKTVICSSDDIVASLNLKQWGDSRGMSVLDAYSYEDKNDYRGAAFEQAEAGITGADFAFAESATLAIRHSSEQARLVSIAPPVHIAIFPVERLYCYYEEVMPQLWTEQDALPSQLTFITGPSLTADIAATPTIGMHGPKKLFVIIIG